jgi:hypothetical protein
MPNSEMKTKETNGLHVPICLIYIAQVCCNHSNIHSLKELQSKIIKDLFHLLSQVPG